MVLGEKYPQKKNAYFGVAVPLYIRIQEVIGSNFSQSSLFYE